MQSIVNVALVNWRHRLLIKDLVRRDFKVRYLGSLLGSYWNFVHPLAMISIYTLIFSHVMKAKIGEDLSPFSYTLYLCAGMLPWTSFTETLSRGTGAFFEYANLIKKVSFPKEILQLVVAFSSCITLFISLAVYMLLLVVTGRGLSIDVLWFPAIFALQIVFTAGLAMMLSVLNVFFRDVQQILNIVLQIWFWLTPIVYLIDRLPKVLQFFVKLNPFYYFASCYQNIFYFQRPPETEHLVGILVLSLLALAVGCRMHQVFKNEIVDEL